MQGKVDYLPLVDDIDGSPQCAVRLPLPTVRHPRRPQLAAHGTFLASVLRRDAAALSRSEAQEEERHT
jgi:hypothetical protein